MLFADPQHASAGRDLAAERRRTVVAFAAKARRTVVVIGGKRAETVLVCAA